MSLDRNKISLLIITKGILYSLDTVNSDKYNYLRQEFDGYLIHRVADPKFRRLQLDGFQLYGCYIPELIARSNLLSNLYYLVYSVFAGVYIFYTKPKKFDVVISRNPLASGIAAVLVVLFTRTKLIIEVNGNFASKLIWENQLETLAGKIKFHLTQIIIPLVLKFADGIKLLYDTQIDAFRWIGIKSKTFRFHEYVPVSRLQASEQQGDYVLFLGHPWDIKGVDVLIKAFNAISEHVPSGIYLRIIGYFPEPDLSMLRTLAGGNPKIHIEKAVFHNEAMLIMSQAKMVVLPSRTEAMGRVLLEAMAQKKPLVASRVDGIPTYVKHGETGLLVEPDNDQALGQAILTLLNDASYAQQLAENACHYVNTVLTEENYMKQYSYMINEVFN